MTTYLTAQQFQRLTKAQQREYLSHLQPAAGTFFDLPLGGLFGDAAGAATEGEAAAATEGDAAASKGSSIAKGAAGGAASSAASNLLKSLTKDATIGAVLADLIHGGSLKYTAIWLGLFVLGLVLIVKGFGGSPRDVAQAKLVPVPA